MAAFTPKPFAAITADMIEQVRANSTELTDFNVGSVIRTMLEASAIEIENAYFAQQQALQEAIPASLYRAFGFSRLPVARASGKERITLLAALDDDFTIPAGREFSTVGSDVNFVSTEDLVIPAGQLSGLVTVQAETAGVVGNVPAHTITIMPSALAEVAAVTNPWALTLGRDVESDAEMQERFTAYVLALSRATPSAIEYIAKATSLLDADGIATEYVQRVAIAEGAGSCILYVYNGSGNTSSDLIAAVQRAIDGYYDPSTGTTVAGYRAAGVYIDVRGMTDKPVPVVLQASTLPGYWDRTVLASNLVTAIQYAIQTAPSGTPLPLARLINAALTVNGMRDCIITTPSGAVPCAASEALIPDTITISWT